MMAPTQRVERRNRRDNLGFGQGDDGRGGAFDLLRRGWVLLATMAPTVRPDHDTVSQADLHTQQVARISTHLGVCRLAFRPLLDFFVG
jgi:hypothetical protein